MKWWCLSLIGTIYSANYTGSKMTEFVSMIISYIAMFSCGLLIGMNVK
jgi:hypothetical protein